MRPYGERSEPMDPWQEPVLSLMYRYDPDHPHAQQVERLACLLFHQFAGLHQMPGEALSILKSASLLHDIGWSVSGTPHHKASMQLILADTSIPCTPRERTLMALIARYHRKASPSLDHSRFARLTPEDQHLVCWSAALLRVADGLDAAHRSLVRHIDGTITDQEIVIRCLQERAGAYAFSPGINEKKLSLLKELSGREVTVLWN